MTRLASLRDVAREHGIGGLLLHAVQSLGWRLGGRVRAYKYLIVAQPAPGSARRPRAAGAIEVREITPDDYRLEWFPRPAEVIEARFSQGSTCFVAFRDGEAIGCLWLVPGCYLEDEVRCVFEPRPAERCVWDYDVYVAPPHRLGRAFSRLWQAAGDWMRSRGYTHSMSRINAFNKASVQAHRRAGARPIGRIVFLCAGPLQLSFSSHRPRVAVCVGARGVPRFAFSLEDAGNAPPEGAGSAARGGA